MLESLFGFESRNRCLLAVCKDKRPLSEKFQIVSVPCKNRWKIGYALRQTKSELERWQQRVPPSTEEV